MILFTIFPFAPPPPLLAFLCLKLFRSLYIWFSMPPVCHFPLFFIHFIMLYDFRPTGWKMTIILLQQPAINRAEEYMEWRAEWKLQCKKKKTHTHAEEHTCIQVNTAYKYSKNTCIYAATVRFVFSFSPALSQTHTFAYTYCTIKQQKAGLWPGPREEWSQRKSRTKREIRHCKVMPFKCTFSVAEASEFNPYLMAACLAFSSILHKYIWATGKHTRGLIEMNELLNHIFAVRDMLPVIGKGIRYLQYW